MALFAAIGQLVRDVREALRSGDLAAIGPLLNENHRLLQIIVVSSPELDRLVLAARDAGAAGAKLSGGGGGGIMVALATETALEDISRELAHAGATRVIVTRLPATAP
jgi:mevalonate kinase